MTDLSTPLSGWSTIVGQPVAVERLATAVASPVHSYLFVGPRGSGKRQAARIFAGELIAAGAGEAGDPERDRRLAAAEEHPDLVIIEPEGRTFRTEEAAMVITEGSRSPAEGSRKVIVIDRFQTAEPTAAARLLKTIEEPPATTTFVLLAEEVPPEHITIASRCVQIDFAPVPVAAIVEALAADGVAEDRQRFLAEAAGGNLDRARLLASDEQFADRRAAWWSAPDRLDGSGAAVAVLVEELRAMIDDAQLPLTARHDLERDELAEREERLGTRGSGRSVLEARHKREIRLLRDDEVRLGLATLAARYRDGIETAADRPQRFAAVKRLSVASEALERNPNEALLLQALLLDLPNFSH